MVVGGQVWWFGVMDLLSLFATVLTPISVDANLEQFNEEGENNTGIAISDDIDEEETGAE